MIGYAIGGLVLVLGAFAFSLWIAYRKGRTDGYQAKISEMSENRARLRTERQAAKLGPHQLAPFPDRDWAETLADTGELRALAETGDMASVRGHVAAFWRTLSLHEWTRKEPAA